jgi:hypothetical protein
MRKSRLFVGCDPLDGFQLLRASFASFDYDARWIILRTFLVSDCICYGF